MSGGSYDYLCWAHEHYLGKLVEGGFDDDLERMRDRLVALGYTVPAKETEAFLLKLRRFRLQVEAMGEHMSGIWHAVEWRDSGDWGDEQMKEKVDAELAAWKPGGGDFAKRA